MDRRNATGEALLMAKKVSPPVEIPAVYVGEWIRACNSTPAEVARETKINEGYLSQIISGKKKNPSRAILALIATFLEISPSTFDAPPPSQAALDQIEGLSPDILLQLTRRRSPSK